MKDNDDVSGLSQLGSKQTDYKLSGPHVGILETFPNPAPERDYDIIHDTDEFSSLCPKTGQPDFACLTITYVADEKCVESKSLKLYLFAFRNEGAFMERITNCILDDLVQCLDPRRCQVAMSFNSRGGIRTSVVAEYQKESPLGG